MAGPNTAGTSGALTVSLPTVLSRFMLKEQERGKVLNCATREVLPPHTGNTFNYLNYDYLFAYATSEGVDAAQAQSLSDAKTAFTPGEIVVNVIVGDRTISRVADPNLIGEVGEMAMNAIELKEDTDGCAKFSSFTLTVGSTTVCCTPGHLFTAEALLRVGGSKTLPEPAPGPWFAVLHPFTMASAGIKLIPLSTVASSNAYTLTTAEGTVAKLGGVPAAGTTNDKGVEMLASKNLLRQWEMGELMVLSDANVTLSGADAVSGIFSQRGLVYVSEVTPYQKQERDESLRGVEITCVESYAWGNYRPGQYGIAATFDATTPTN